MKKIVLCGGGTAGHVYPALAVAEKLQDFEIHFFGGSGIEKNILKEYPNIIYHEISAVRLERKLTAKNLLIPFKLFKAIKQAKNQLEKVKPDIIFSKGGFVSVPVVVAGKKLGVPVISHESDLSFGLANKIILHYCDCMCTTFEKTGKGKKKCVCTGQPIRKKILYGKKQDFFDRKNCSTLLVLGGSLGSQFLNKIVFENIDVLTEKFNIIHICGKNNYQKIVHENYKLFAYTKNIEDFYATADIVVSRSGSGAINELAMLKKPMLLIPLSKKASRGDQIENAKLFAQLGYAEVMEEDEFTFEKFLQKLDLLQKNSIKMQKNMQKTAKNNAVEQIVDLIQKYSKKQN